MTTTEERLSRLEAGYEHLATKAGVEGLRAGLETLRADFHSILREVRAENNRRFDQINQRIDRLFWANHHHRRRVAGGCRCRLGAGPAVMPFLVRFCAPPLEHGGAFLTILAWDSRLSTNSLSVTVLTVAADGFGGQGVSQFSPTGQALDIPEQPLQPQEGMLHPRSQSGAGSWLSPMPSPPAPPRSPDPASAAAPAASPPAVPPPAPGSPPFAHSLVARITPRHRLPAVQQMVRFRNAVDVGRCRAHAVDYARLRVNPHVRLHPQMPLATLLGLMHLWVPLPGPILGGRRRLDDGAVHDGSLPQLQPLGFQVSVDFLRQTLPQPVPFQEMTEVEDGGLVGQGA